MENKQAVERPEEVGHQSFDGKQKPKNFKPRHRDVGLRRDDRSCKPNDIRWYAQSDILLKDAASLAYSNPQGVEVTGTKLQLPSCPMVVYRTLPSIGKASLASDIPTVAARQIYSFVRHANSGSTNYEAPDLMMYLLAMGEVYSAYAWLTRIYGSLLHFNGFNRSIPKDLFRLYGVNYDDLIKHIADLRLFINQTAQKINSFFVPKSFPYFERKVFIYSGLFKDMPEAKAEIYFYQPVAFLKFDGTTDPNGSMLGLYYLPSTMMDFGALTNFINGLIDPLLAEEDINIMSGDILKAYGTNVFTVNPIPEDYAIAPTYSGEMLAQSHNATVLCHSSIPAGGWEIHQTKTGVIQQTKVISLNDTMVKAGVSNRFATAAQLLDADDNTDPAYNMIATRLKCYGHANGETDGSETFTVDESGTEVIVATEFTLVSGGESYTRWAAFGFDQTVSSFYNEFINAIRYTTHYHYAPYVALHDTANNMTYTMVGEINNFTVLEPSTAAKCNSVAFMSLFNVSAGPVVLAVAQRSR